MAANPRIQVQSGLEPERFQPQASPVDTFTNERGGGEKLARLAQSLAEISPALARYSASEARRTAEEQEMKGQHEAQKLHESQKTYLDAVKAGDIREDQNPWFRLGMKRQFAIKAADEYAYRLQGATAELLANKVTDPRAFQNMEAELRKTFVSEYLGDYRDAGFDSFFADNVNTKAAGIAQQFAARAGANAVEVAIADFGDITYGIMAEEIPLEERVAKLQAELDTAVNVMGINPRMANMAMANAFLQYAKEEKDLSLLGIAPKVDENGEPTGELDIQRDGLLHQIMAGNQSLGNRPEIAKMILDTAHEIGANYAHEQNTRDREVEANKRNHWLSFNNALAAHLEAGNDIADFDATPFSEAMRPLDAEAATAMNGFAEMQGRRDVQAERNPQIYDDLIIQARRLNVNEAQLLGQVHAGNINGNDYNTLVNLLQSERAYRASQNTAERDIIESPMFQRHQRIVDTVMDAEGLVQKALSRITRLEGVNAAKLATLAKGDAQHAFLNWLRTDEGQAANSQQQRDMAAQVTWDAIENRLAITEEELNQWQSDREANPNPTVLTPGGANNQPTMGGAPNPAVDPHGPVYRQGVIWTPREIDLLNGYFDGRVGWSDLPASIMEKQRQHGIPNEEMKAAARSQRAILMGGQSNQ